VIAAIVGASAGLVPALAHAASGNAARISHMLSSRGFWVAVTISLGGAYSWWNSQRRRKSIDGLMQRRALSKVPPANDREDAAWHYARNAIERELKTELPHLRPDDPMRSLMKWAEIRAVIGALEDELDIDLPDTRRVLNLTVGEFAELLQRGLKRRAS
jgi:hypothetical protein